MAYDKEEVKESLELSDMFSILESLGGEPHMYGTYLSCRTICHNGDHHKLFYYDNTKLFKCYSGDCGTFDIFELINKVNGMSLNDAVYYVVNYFNLQYKLEDRSYQEQSEDWKILDRYKRLLSIETNDDEIILPKIDDALLSNYPTIRIKDWEDEGITKEVCEYMGIRYNPCNGSIIIPHYDIDNRLVRIRERTLVKEQEKFGKYRPAIISGVMCNHPLAFNLYGINKTKSNIEKAGVAIVVEGEKSVLKSMSFFGPSNNLAVAVCGNSLSQKQVEMLMRCGAREIVVGFDADYHEIDDDDYKKTVSHLKKLHEKYSASINISFLFDKSGELLGYKDSPFDKGKDMFLALWKDRVIL